MKWWTTLRDSPLSRTGISRGCMLSKYYAKCVWPVFFVSCLVCHLIRTGARVLQYWWKGPPSHVNSLIYDYWDLYETWDWQCFSISKRLGIISLVDWEIKIDCTSRWPVNFFLFDPVQCINLIDFPWITVIKWWYKHQHRCFGRAAAAGQLGKLRE